MIAEPIIPVLNSFMCPHCRRPFPFFIKPSMTIRRSFFQSPDLKCERCGELSRIRIDYKSALIAWPITAAYVGTIGLILRHMHASRYLREAAWWQFTLVAIPILLPFLIGLRRGLKLVEAHKGEEPGKTKYNKWIAASVIAFTMVLLSYYYKGDWLIALIHVAISLVIGLICFYLFSTALKK